MTDSQLPIVESLYFAFKINLKLILNKYIIIIFTRGYGRWHHFIKLFLSLFNSPIFHMKAMIKQIGKFIPNNTSMEYFKNFIVIIIKLN